MGVEAIKYCAGNVSKIFQVDRLCSSNSVPAANKGEGVISHIEKHCRHSPHTPNSVHDSNSLAYVECRLLA
jgi:hypothetical protein